MTEHWKTISEAPRYKISNLGNVLSLINNIPKLSFPDKKGYMRVQLYKAGGIKITRKIHRLVAYYFIDNINGLPQVNHKDGDKKNNHSSNLEWVTNKENMAHSVKEGLHIKRHDVVQLLPQIRTAINDNFILKDIAKLYNITPSHIADLLNRFNPIAEPITTLMTGRKFDFIYYDKSRCKWRTDLRSGLHNKQFDTKEEALNHVKNQLSV